MNGNWSNAVSGTVATGQTVLANTFIVLASTATESSRLVQNAAGATVAIEGIVIRTDPSAMNAGPNTAAAAGDTVSYLSIPGQQCYLVVNAQSTNIAPGDPITSTAAGIGIKATADNQWVGAKALAPATTDGVAILVETANFTLVVP